MSQPPNAAAIARETFAEMLRLYMAPVTSGDDGDTDDGIPSWEDDGGAC